MFDFPSEAITTPSVDQDQAGDEVQAGVSQVALSKAKRIKDNP
jgi:hypothetical protein